MSRPDLDYRVRDPNEPEALASALRNVLVQALRPRLEEQLRRFAEGTPETTRPPPERRRVPAGAFSLLSCVS